ncbi:MAG: hypothetical protein KDH95_06190 [Calditrichaeota bacterium]|nr:hypothetical protein [Calditrichota bacterium]MCB0267736.1 hypothetical protein [Calditrichota bacterium]
MPEEKIRVLYDALSPEYDLGDFETFSQKLQDPAKRRSFYDEISKSYNLGDFETFSQKVGGGPWEKYRAAGPWEKYQQIPADIGLVDALQQRIMNEGVLTQKFPGNPAARVAQSALNIPGILDNVVSSFLPPATGKPDLTVNQAIAQDQQISDTKLAEWLGIEPNQLAGDPGANDPAQRQAHSLLTPAERVKIAEGTLTDQEKTAIRQRTTAAFDDTVPQTAEEKSRALKGLVNLTASPGNYVSIGAAAAGVLKLAERFGKGSKIVRAGLEALPEAERLQTEKLLNERAPVSPSAGTSQQAKTPPLSTIDNQGVLTPKNPSNAGQNTSKLLNENNALTAGASKQEPGSVKPSPLNDGNNQSITNTTPDPGSAIAPDNVLTTVTAGSAPEIVTPAAPKPAAAGLVPDGAKIFIRKYFKSGGNKPDVVKREAERLKGRVSARIRLAKLRTNELHRLVKKSGAPFKELNSPDGLKLMDAYLKREPSANFDDLPAEVKTALDNMRTDIDALSRELMRSPLVGEKLALTIEENLGTYATRVYRKFLDPGYKPSKESLAKAHQLFSHVLPSELVGELPNLNYISRRSKLSGAGFETVSDIAAATPDRLMQTINTRGYTAEMAAADIAAAKTLAKQLPERVRGRVDFLLNKDLDQQFFNTGTALGRVNRSTLKERKQVGEVIRELYGEVKDPFVNYNISTSKMISMLENRRFLDQMQDFNKALPDGDPQKFFYKTPFTGDQGSYSVKIAAEGNKALEPLDGLYTTKAIADEFTDFAKSKDISTLQRIYATLNSTAKYTKTVLSPTRGSFGIRVKSSHIWTSGSM